MDKQCTGYVVNPDGYIATAGHCVEAALAKDDLKLIAAEWATKNDYYASDTLKPGEVIGDYSVYGVADDAADPELVVDASWAVSAGGVKTGRNYKARVLNSQGFAKGDGAILKIEQTGLPALKLAKSGSIEVGQDIVAIGYPVSVDEVTDADLNPSFKDGSVSSKKTIDGGLLTVYEISAATSGGMSGGPVVDVNTHEVIGFVSYGNSDETQQFNFVRPSTIITELMNGEGVKNNIGKLSQDYNAGLDAFFAGEKGDAVKNLQAVVNEEPSNEFASKYLKEANKLSDPFPVGLVAGLGVGALALIGAGVALMVRKRKGKGRGGSAASEASTAPAPASTPSAAPAAPGDETPAAPPATTMVMDPPPAPESASDASKSNSIAPSASDPLGFKTKDAPVEVRAVHDQFCGSCGARPEPGARFCIKCGHAL